MTTDFDPTSQRQAAQETETYDAVDENFDNVRKLSSEALSLMSERVATVMGHIACADTRDSPKNPDTDEQSDR